MLKLRLLNGPRAGRQLRVSDLKPVSVGRRKGRLRLHDSRVSKRHAEISFEQGVWILRDFDSANGTYINQKKVRAPVQLESGDLLQMGRVLIKITRCDKVGMDTPPNLLDTVLHDDQLNAGAPSINTEPAEGLDADDPLEPAEQALGMSSSRPRDPLEVATNAHAAGQDADKFQVLETDAEAPETLEVDLNEPTNEEDSFFEDLGETPVTPNDAMLDEQTSGQESEESQYQPPVDEQPPSDHSVADGNPTLAPHDASAIDEQDDSPALASLHLDQAPPQQPPPEVSRDTESPITEEDLDQAIESTTTDHTSEAEFELASDTPNETPSHAAIVDEQADAETSSADELANIDPTVDETSENNSSAAPLPEDTRVTTSDVAIASNNESRNEDAPFDIDAAFDALSEGLG